MAKLIVTGIFTLNQWKVHRVSDMEWQAWISDSTDIETGAPLLKSSGFESLVEKIEIFELGGQHANSDN